MEIIALSNSKNIVDLPLFPKINLEPGTLDVLCNPGSAKTGGIR
jgi:hypothetical protein